MIIPVITTDVVKGIIEALTQCRNLYRWPDGKDEDLLNEKVKQAMNAYMTYFLAIIAKHNGKEVTWTDFPKLVLYRIFEKIAYINN